MPTQYAVFENNLVAAPADFMAVVQIVGGTELRIGRLSPVLTVQAGKMGNLGDLKGVSARERTVSNPDSTPSPCLASVSLPKPGSGTEVKRTSDRGQAVLVPWSC